MALYLVQHGLSLFKEEDPERGLSEQGIRETRDMAARAAAQNIQVSRIIHSGKKRAMQTAELFAEALQPHEGTGEEPGLAPMDDVTLFAARVNINQNLMVVGHLPFMERLVSYLLTGSPDAKVIQFQNSGIICLDSEDGPFFVRWALYPRLG